MKDKKGEERKGGRGGVGRQEGKIERRVEKRRKEKPFAQRQEMVIGTLALLWYFVMVAVM